MIKRFDSWLYGHARSMWVTFHRVKIGVASMVWWVRYHTTKRNHILDVRSIGSDYKYGYICQDYLLLLAAFKCLCLYIENEAEWDGTEEDCPECEKSLWDLYDWWCYERPLSYKALRNRPIDRKTFSMETELYQRDSFQLQRLVSLRQYLWS